MNKTAIKSLGYSLFIAGKDFEKARRKNDLPELKRVQSRVLILQRRIKKELEK